MITLMVGGIRGDFRKSTRPINLVDANRHTSKIQHADFILNTPFTIIRTFNKQTFKKVFYDLEKSEVDRLVQPLKAYPNTVKNKPNIVVFITESFGREYMGAFNDSTQIKDYVSYTPFLDSLATKSLIFNKAYANGRKSIHGMSSVLAGIPSFKDAFTSSPYANQDIESVVSILNSEGYDTSFFHGAPNGSMGFLGFSNILGFDNYYGKTEFNNDALFDGVWGIWDDPFFQFMKTTLDTKTTPFFSTIFTVTSHEPYIVPNEYEGVFPKGDVPMHQCVGYTDFAFKQFFEAAKKEPWFQNTIFIITADHSNQIRYSEYRKLMNRLAVPIMIYSPNGKFTGVKSELAQQIDIYPTIIDMVGYNQPFRSWGRSLVSEKPSKMDPFVVSFIGQNYMYSEGNIICIFDGVKAVGFYDVNDLGLETNLISNRTTEMDAVELKCKAFLKDYFERIVDRNL
jgi:phosphoglycerol transferase MdoB-like AlkP superfamily enzyme